MFEARTDIAEMIDQLVVACAPLDRGDVLPHATIAHILGVPPHRDHWQHCIRRLRIRLEDDRGITLWSERTVGYKLLTYDEHLDVPRRRMRKAHRQVNTGMRAVKALPTGELSDHQRHLRAVALESLRDLRRDLISQEKYAGVAAKPSETAPRPKPRRQPAGAV